MTLSVLPRQDAGLQPMNLLYFVYRQTHPCCSAAAVYVWYLRNGIQVLMTVIKYIPQATFNILRKSTDGFSIGNILLDFSGGIANYAQMVVQSVDQDSWVNFYGNIGKVLLSLVSVFFDIIFIIQHYVLYPARKASKLVTSSEHDDQITEHLVRASDQAPPENV